MKTALVAGATGLIGNQLVNLLLESKHYDKVITVVRNPTGLNHEKLSEVKADFRKLSEYGDTLAADDVFCCLGTTMAKARSKEKFYEVDFTFPFELAKLSVANNARQFLIVSALGADKSSSIYYNTVKGEVEGAVSTLPFEAVHIFRPSLLLGPRNEKRSAEDAAKFFYRIFGFLIPEKYKAIESFTVAQAMLHFASLEQKGVYIHESAALRKIRHD